MKAPAITLATVPQAFTEPRAITREVDAESRQARRCIRRGDIRLTPRQAEVLALLCAGLPNKLICRELGIAPGTVKTHIGAILGELGVSSRLHAVVVAQRLGLHRIQRSHAPTDERMYGVPAARIETARQLTAP